MINEKVNLKETVTVQLIKGKPDDKDASKLILNQIKPRPIESPTLDGCGMPSITMNREVFGLSVKGEKNDNDN